MLLYATGLDSSHVENLRNTGTKVQQERHWRSSEDGRRHRTMIAAFTFLKPVLFLQRLKYEAQGCLKRCVFLHFCKKISGVLWFSGFSAGEGISVDAARVEGDDEEEQTSLDDVEEEVEVDGTGFVQTARRRRRLRHERKRSARRPADVEPRKAALHHRPRNSQTRSQVNTNTVTIINI